jgi:pimeloyl-ACP methyl ester carboxylesterase
LYHDELLQSFSLMNPQPKPVSVRRLAKLLLLSLVVFYLGICIMMAAIQRSLLYYPRVFSSAEVDQMALIENLQRWTNASGANIGFKRLSPKQPAQGSVMVMYGNGSTAIDSAHYADDIQQVAALDVYILEYPGYEDRPGKPTEKSLFDAGADGLQTLPANQPVYLVGESLGSGVASYLAETFTNRIAGMILISPFTSVAEVAQYHYPILPVRLLIEDRFPSEDYLRNYHGKVGITVDGNDVVVPEKFGLRLYNGYNGPKKLWQFPDGGHCEITEPQMQFWKEAVAFWQTP